MWCWIQGIMGLKALKTQFTAIMEVWKGWQVCVLTLSLGKYGYSGNKKDCFGLIYPPQDKKLWIHILSGLYQCFVSYIYEVCAFFILGTAVNVFIQVGLLADLFLNKQLSYLSERILCLVQIRLGTEVLRTPSPTRPGFELTTSRSWQYTSCHWHGLL